MICNANDKNSRKLLVAALAMFMIIAGAAIVLSDEASAVPDNAGTTKDVGTFEELKQVLTSPGDVTTVNLTADITITSTINTSADGITINGAKTNGTGNWKIIDNSGTDHAIGLETSAMFTFQNIDFVSQTDAYGTVLNINNQSALIKDCSFVGTANHGAVQVFGAADVTIDSCTFDDLAKVHLNYVTSDTITFKGCTGVTLAVASNGDGVDIAITDLEGDGQVKIDSPDTIKKLVLGWDFGNGYNGGAPDVQIATEVNVDEVAVGADTESHTSGVTSGAKPTLTETGEGSITSATPLPEDVTYGTTSGTIITGTITEEVAATLDSATQYVFRDVTIENGVTVTVNRVAVDEGTVTNNGTINANVRMEGGELVNNGTINAEYLNIIGGTVTNNGTISITKALQNNAGTNTYFLDNADDGVINVSGNLGAIAINNSGRLNISGTVEAASVTNSGRVALTGNQNASAMTILGGTVDLTAYTFSTTITIAGTEDPVNVTYYPTMGDSRTTVIYKDLKYTIYQADYNNANYQYGVYLEPIDWAETITIEKLVSSAIAFPVDADHYMDLGDLEQPTWYERVTGGYTGELRNYTVGYNEGKVLYNGYVTLSNGTTSTFWKILGLYINPVEATISDVDLKPWDVKNEPNTPTFTYTIDGHDYVYPDLPEGATATITLVKDGQSWTMDQWGEITEAGDYTLVITVPAWGNYGEATDNTYTVTLENETDRDSLLTFQAYGEDLAYGISVDRLQNGLELPTDFTINTHATNGTITATVYYLDSYPGFWAEAEDQAGYYIVFALAQDESATGWQDAYLSITGPVSQEAKVFDGTFDGFFVLYLGKEIPAQDLTFSIAYDQDGREQNWYTTTTYNITLDVTGDEWNYPGIYLYDERNESWAADDYYYLMTSVSDTYQLPSVSKDGAPNGWYSEVADEYFKAGSLFTISDKYADASGRIVLKAQYDGTGGDTSLENASQNVTTYISSIDGGIRVLIEAIDAGAYVDSGSLVVSYTYAHHIGNITIYQTHTMTAVPVNSNGTAYLAVELDISADANYMSITGMMVTYTGDNGSSDASDMISYTPSLPETAAVRA